MKYVMTVMYIVLHSLILAYLTCIEISCQDSSLMADVNEWAWP